MSHFFGNMVPHTGGFGGGMMGPWNQPMRQLARGGDWWDWPMVPQRIYDQPFGMGWENEFMPYWARQSMNTVEREVGESEGGTSHVTNNKDVFQVDLNVSHFMPEEVKVTQRENQLVIEGKHEERTDPHGLVSRHFVRKYALPKDVDPATVASSLSADGMLTVKASKIAIEGPKERAIPIQHSGEKTQPGAVEGMDK